MRYLILLFSFFGATVSFSQQLEKYRTQENRVIAVPGLNMRDQPSLTGNKVGFIPFGKEVKILEPQKFYRDTVGSISNYNRQGSPQHYRNPVIDGYWVKARYRGKTGYVFSAYLIDYRKENEYPRKIEDQGINQDFIIMIEGTNCMDNYHFKTDWHYYGARGTAQGICLEPVEMSFVKTMEGYANLETRSSAKEYSPKFIIGSKEPLSTEERSAFLNCQIQTNYDFGNPERGGELPQEFTLESTSKQTAPNLILSKDGRQQILNPFNDIERKTRNVARFLKFASDLDGDGQDDYLIQYGEKFSQTVLYLSSKSSGNEIVKPVAVWYSTYCC